MSDRREDRLRVLLVEVPPPHDVEGSVAVGVLPWTNTDPISQSLQPQLGVIAKLELDYELNGGDEPVVATPATDARLRLDAPMEGTTELLYATDFIPTKIGTDVVVVGHAKCAEPQQSISAGLTVGGMSRGFRVRGEKRARAIRLMAGTITDEHGGATEPVGPQRAVALRETYDADHDFTQCNSAVAMQRLDRLASDAQISLQGLHHAAESVLVRLPNLRPMVTTDILDMGEFDVRLRCDVLWIDVDAHRLALVWRGAIPVADPAVIERLIVSLEHADAVRLPAERLIAAQRGDVSFAVTEIDLRDPRERTEDEEEDLTMERFDLMNAPAPEPAMPIETYAELSAKLAGRSSDRTQLLADHGLDERRYAVEERAWLEKMGRDAREGRMGWSLRYSTLYDQAQARLSTLERGDDESSATGTAESPGEAEEPRGAT